MAELRKSLFAAFVCVTPLAAFAQTAGIGILPAPNIATINSVPGGITLVPGTVVTSAVGGTTVTGTVPLAGTVGSPGVTNLNPGIYNSVPGNVGALYPTLTNPQVATPGANQSTLPQMAPQNELLGVMSNGVPSPF